MLRKVDPKIKTKKGVSFKVAPFPLVEVIPFPFDFDVGFIDAVGVINMRPTAPRPGRPAASPT